MDPVIVPMATVGPKCNDTFRLQSIQNLYPAAAP